MRNLKHIGNSPEDEFPVPALLHKPLHTSGISLVIPVQFPQSGEAGMDLGTLGLDVPQLFLFPFRPLAKVVGFLAKGYFLCLGPSLLFLLCFLESLDLLHLCLKLFYSHGTCRGFFFFTLNLPGERLFIFVEVALEVAELRQRAHKLKEFVFGFFQLIAEALACILPFFEPVRGLISCPRCLFALFQGALKLRQDRLPLPLKVFQLGILAGAEAC